MGVNMSFLQVVSTELKEFIVFEMLLKFFSSPNSKIDITAQCVNKGRPFSGFSIVNN